MSVTRSLMMGRFSSGPMSRRPRLATLRYMRAAGPARPAVHRHGAGAAHADPAGKTVGQRRVEMALNEGHDIEHRLVFAQRDTVSLVSALFRAAPERYGQVGSRVGHRFSRSIQWRRPSRIPATNLASASSHQKPTSGGRGSPLDKCSCFGKCPHDRASMRSCAAVPVRDDQEPQPQIASAARLDRECGRQCGRSAQ